MLSNAIVWTIAGSDCTGGAGIQADTKTIHNLGATACSIITAVTAQNSQGVLEINAVSNEVLLSQVKALLEEYWPDVIKIGLLANKSQIQQVARLLKQLKQYGKTAPRVVYDPVAIATNGDNLTEEDILPTIKEVLLPLVDVLTPNYQELQRLTGVYVFSWDCLEAAAQRAVELGPAAVILKGGHIDIAKTYSVDYCYDGYQHFWLANKRIKAQNTHGTGCTFASAVAALLAQNSLLRDAFTLAKAYIQQAIQAANTAAESKNPKQNRAVWQGSWPDQNEYFPEVLVPYSSLAKELDWHPPLTCHQSQPFVQSFEPLEHETLYLYPIVDSIAWLQRLLKAGIKTIQYREKKLQGEKLDKAILQAVQLGKKYDARLFINDHWSLAIKHYAYGVHLGQEDIVAADLQAIKAAGLRLGISTHGHYELLKAKSYSPSYLAIGAIFPTKTKNMTGQIQGLTNLKRLVRLHKQSHEHIPIIAIGGIDLEKAASVIQTGVDSIAVVTAITEAEDPEAAVNSFLEILSNNFRENA